MEQALDKYLTGHSSLRSEALDWLVHQTNVRTNYPQMLSGPVQGELLKMLVGISGARDILEIGTFTGYSTICMALGLEDGGTLDSYEINDELEDLAREAFRRAGVEDRIRLHIGDFLSEDLSDRSWDFVYIDAGTTTEKMIDFLPDKKVTFVTNAFVHAKKLAQRGFKVYIPAGEIKVATEAIVGAECVSSLQGYNFTKSFIGANGISLSAGITTPDRNEASVKSAAVQNSKTIYVLADHSKFNQIASVTFAQLGWVKIITDKLQDKKYHTKANIKEVM